MFQLSSRKVITVLMVALLPLFVLVQPKSLSAESMIELRADQRNFNEHFDEATNVSGSVIVGVRLGTSTDKVRLDNIYFVPPPSEDICVRSVTRDGRFSANNIYRVLNNQASSGTPARLLPLTLRYADALSQYTFDALAIAAFSATDEKCIPDQSVYIPQILQDNIEKGEMTIFINSGGRHSKIVTNSGANVVKCTDIHGPRITFDKSCNIQLEKIQHGKNKFTLVLEDGFDEENVHFTVLVP